MNNIDVLACRDLTEVEAEQKMLQAVCVYFHFLFTFVLVIFGVAYLLLKLIKSGFCFRPLVMLEREKRDHCFVP